jgi:hypothetical protein
VSCSLVARSGSWPLPRGRGSRKTVKTTDAEGPLGKAVAYQEAAEESLAAQRWDPAVSNAVHAGILAADAISVKRTGERWAGDHQLATGHLKRAGAKEAANHLQRLLSKKVRAEYDPVPSSKEDAEQAIKTSKRLVDMAGEVVHGTPPTV